MRPEILLVEDDPAIADPLALQLDAAGFAVEAAASGERARSRLDARRYDLVILDVMLPRGPDGFALCRNLRSRSPYTPILMLTARDAEEDRVRGLELGADDYVTKPFSTRELVARVRGLLRRARASGEGGAGQGAIAYPGLEIDPGARTVRVRGEPVELAPREFDLLVHFALHPGRVFTRAALLDQVWGPAHEGYEHTVNSHINRVRSKIERDPSAPRWVLTVWGVGYKFEAPREAEG